jgi:hypothetical protein
MILIFPRSFSGTAVGFGKFAQYIVIGTLQSEVSGARVLTLNWTTILRPSSTRSEQEILFAFTYQFLNNQLQLKLQGTKH